MVIIKMKSLGQANRVAELLRQMAARVSRSDSVLHRQIAENKNMNRNFLLKKMNFLLFTFQEKVFR
jgi:hypothetical protein